TALPEAAFVSANTSPGVSAAALADCAATAATTAAMSMRIFFTSSPFCRGRHQRRHTIRLGSVRSVTPLAELREQRVARVGIEVVLAQHPGERDRLLELREILAA